MHKLDLKGKFHLNLIRDGKIIESIELNNGITNQGKNNVLDVFFGNATQTPTWYIGLVNNSGFSAFAAGDTHASHSGWTEFTGYSDATRREWVDDAAASQSKTNSALAVFNIDTTGVVKGLFIASLNVKGSTNGSGILWSTAAFANTLNVLNGDVINVTYTCNA
jgi:hypothetical protein